MSDPLADYRRFRKLNIVDDWSRFCPGQIVDLSITGARLARFLDDLALLYRLPEEISWHVHYNTKRPHSAHTYGGPDYPCRVSAQGQRAAAEYCNTNGEFQTNVALTKGKGQRGNDTNDTCKTCSERLPDKRVI